MADDVERTEPPTPRRRAEARKEGQVAVSPELLTIANLLSVSLALLAFFGSGTIMHGARVIRYLWTPRSEINLFVAVDLFRTAFGAAVWLLMPILLITLFCVITTTMAQTKGNIATKRMKPKFSKLNPAKNFSRVVKKDAPIELAKSMVKLLIVGSAIWWAIADNLEDYVGLPKLPLFEIIGFQLGTILKAYIVGALAMIFVGAADFAIVRFRTEKSLKMSKSEVKDETRQMEGDPQVKSRQRSLQMDRARVRMMEKVPEADVVVTNPEHFAVALVYKRSKMAAPTVVAKGRNILALRIRELATVSGVPIVENPPLARALYRGVKVGQGIPERLYQAVAAVLGHVYRLDRTRARAW